MPIDGTVGCNPPSVYLCQVGPNVSCGACCGLYNVSDPSPAALAVTLARRTRWFADVPRTVAGIDAFRAAVCAAERQQGPFPDFHHCPFLGMIEDGGRRVGCLLHPLADGNDGLDWRGLSYYGGMACRTYFCPSVRHLPARWLTAVRQCMSSWYLHGLVITEQRLLTALFTELEHRLGRRINADDFSGRAAADALSNLLSALKLDWPFRRRDAALANYFFEDGRYPRPAVAPPAGINFASTRAAIFQELDTDFPSASAAASAEAGLNGLLDGLTRHLTMSTPWITGPNGHRRSF